MFVAELCRAMATRLHVRVVAPINGLRQWRLTGRLPRSSGSVAGTESVPVHYPVFFNFPRFGKFFDAAFMSLCSESAFRAAASDMGNFPIVHAHYAYPDAVAAVRLGRKYGFPVVITVHGTDVNQLAHDSARRSQIIEAFRHAGAVVAVSNELRRKVNALVGRGFHAFHIPNGVGLDRFSPGDPGFARRKLGLERESRYILAVGRLDPVKGYDLLIQSLLFLPESVRLIVAGDGEQKQNLKNQVSRLGLDRRVSFAGAISHDHLRFYFQSAQLLAISSHSEGWPTVILESLACGTPVVAHRVGGIPEVLVSEELGVLVEDNTPESLARGIQKGLEKNWDANLCIEYARRFTWDRISRKYFEIFDSLYP